MLWISWCPRLAIELPMMMMVGVVNYPIDETKWFYGYESAFDNNKNKWKIEFENKTKQKNNV